MQKTYCSICRRRIVPHTNPTTYTNGRSTTTYTFYFTDGTEPVCLGHKETSDLPVGGLKDLQCHKGVPQAFYDAFENEELQP